MAARLSGEGCVLEDALGGKWDPLDAKDGLDTAAVLSRARKLTAEFYEDD
jgi:hypothetical protein